MSSFDSINSDLSWKCPKPPEKGEDERLTKSHIDTLWWAIDDHKFQRRLGNSWCDIKAFKELYE